MQFSRGLLFTAPRKLLSLAFYVGATTLASRFSVRPSVHRLQAANTCRQAELRTELFIGKSLRSRETPQCQPARARPLKNLLLRPSNRRADLQPLRALPPRATSSASRTLPPASTPHTGLSCPWILYRFRVFCHGQGLRVSQSLTVPCAFVPYTAASHFLFPCN